MNYPAGSSGWSSYTHVICQSCLYAQSSVQEIEYYIYVRPSLLGSLILACCYYSQHSVGFRNDGSLIRAQRDRAAQHVLMQ